MVEPNINGMRAKPYITWHLNWQTRLNKERMVAMPPRMSEDAMKHPSTLLQRAEAKGFPLPIAFEAVPIGGAHARNNTSSEFARTFAPGSWKTSGGLTTEQGVNYGEHRRRGAPVTAADALRKSLQKAGHGRPLRYSESAPQLQPGETFISAEVMRAAPNRSVASILRMGEAGPPEQHHHRRHTSSASSASEVRSHGGESFTAEDAAAEAACMRAAPNRSVASILRMGKAGSPEQRHHRRHTSSASSASEARSHGSEGALAEDMAAGAACMRAAPNRSVASILRAGDGGLPGYAKRRAASSTGGSNSSEASTAHGRSHHHGRSHPHGHGASRAERSAEDEFVSAECMRAAPNRSVASILRMGEAAAQDFS